MFNVVAASITDLIDEIRECERIHVFQFKFLVGSAVKLWLDKNPHEISLERDEHCVVLMEALVTISSALNLHIDGIFHQDLLHHGGV